MVSDLWEETTTANLTVDGNIIATPSDSKETVLQGMLIPRSPVLPNFNVGDVSHGLLC